MPGIYSEGQRTAGQSTYSMYEQAKAAGPRRSRVWAGMQDRETMTVTVHADKFPSLTIVWAPDSVDKMAVCKVLLTECNTEITADVGEFRGKAWRIDLLDYSAQARTLSFLTGGLNAALARQGNHAATDAGLTAVLDSPARSG